MRDLQSVFNNCIMLMDEIGIDYGHITEVTINTRAKRRWGQCHGEYIGFYNGSKHYSYKINISSILLDEDVPLASLQNTIIHEILHTCPGCLNHGPEWKKRAEIVRKKLGYNIKRCSGSEEFGISKLVENRYAKHSTKYVVKCECCGREVIKYRTCSIVKYPNLWRCGKCGGNFKRVA